MNLPRDPRVPDWHWGTAEGSREFDRMLDREMTFREKLQWLEDMETWSLALKATLGTSPTDASDDYKPVD